MSRTSQPAAPRATPGAADAATDAARTAARTAARRTADAAHDATLAIERKHTTAAEAGVHKPPGVANSVFEAGRLAKPARKPRKPTVMIDLATIVVETGVALPGKVPRAATRAYETLLAQLVPGTSVLLPRYHAKTLLSAAKKRGLKVTSRVVDEQLSRVWCLSGGSEVAAAAAAHTAPPTHPSWAVA